jgi:Domain of unknown function (DUF3303)
MVIERYKHGPQPVYDRAAANGRMLPSGLVYLDSWVDERSLECCFQLMETEEPKLLDEWIVKWRDLVEFDVIPVISSGDVAERLDQLRVEDGREGTRGR